MSILCPWMMGATHVKTTKGFIGKVCDITQTGILIKVASFGERTFDCPIEKIAEAWFDFAWRNGWVFTPASDLDHSIYSFMHFSRVLESCEFQYEAWMHAPESLERKRKLWIYKRDMLSYYANKEAARLNTYALEKLDDGITIDSGQLGFL